MIFKNGKYNNSLFGLLFLLGIILFMFNLGILKTFGTNPNRIVKKTSKKYVAISTSLETDKDFYMFYLPMTCESWRRIGFEPIIIMVVSDINDPMVDIFSYNYNNETKINKTHINANLNQLQLKVIEYLNRLQVKIFYMRAFKSYEAQLGMLARLLIGYISDDYIEDDDYVIMSDTDLIPIKHAYYEFDNKTEAITVWNAFCCTAFEFDNVYYAEYPMCHIGMKKYMWKRILTYNGRLDRFIFKHSSAISLNRSSIVRVINEFFGQNQFVINSALGRGDSSWYIDQHFISILIDKYVHQYNITLNKNRYTGIRLDRIFVIDRWLELVKNAFLELTDAHCFQELTPETINATQSLNEKLFNSNMNALLNEYFKEYFKIKSDVTARYNLNSIVLQNL